MNQPPERFLAFPNLTLAHGKTSAPIPLADHLRGLDVLGTAARITVRLAGQTRTIDLALHAPPPPRCRLFLAIPTTTAATSAMQRRNTHSDSPATNRR